MEAIDVNSPSTHQSTRTMEEDQWISFNTNAKGARSLGTSKASGTNFPRRRQGMAQRAQPPSRPTISQISSKAPQPLCGGASLITSYLSPQPPQPMEDPSSVPCGPSNSIQGDRTPWAQLHKATPRSYRWRGRIQSRTHSWLQTLWMTKEGPVSGQVVRISGFRQSMGWLGPDDHRRSLNRVQTTKPAGCFTYKAGFLCPFLYPITSDEFLAISLYYWRCCEPHHHYYYPGAHHHRPPLSLRLGGCTWPLQKPSLRTRQIVYHFPDCLPQWTGH